MIAPDLPPEPDLCLAEHPEDGIGRMCMRPKGHGPIHVHTPTPVRTTRGIDWECSTCPMRLLVLDAGLSSEYLS